jgi:folate-binding protein YgfZ
MKEPAAVSDRAAAHIEISGIKVAAHFGDPALEYEAARDDVGLCTRPWRVLTRVGGNDRATFLQGLLSNDVVGLAAGSGCRALFLDNKGHVRADLDVWADEDSLVLGSAADVAEGVLPDLRRYVLAADVVFEELDEQQAVLGVIGPQAESLLGAVGAGELPDAAQGHARAVVAGTDVRIARTLSLGDTGFEVHVPSPAIDDVWQALEAAAGDATPAYIGWQAAEAVRIEDGVPYSGREITGEEFPQELGLDRAIDYDKGCYLGQETVARIHYRGQVNRLLRGFKTSVPAHPGAALLAGEQSVGRVTSVADSPRWGPIALGFVRREEAAEGTGVSVRLDDGTVGAATVVEPPFGG